MSPGCAAWTLEVHWDLFCGHVENVSLGFHRGCWPQLFAWALVFLHEMSEVSSLSILGLLGEKSMFVFYKFSKMQHWIHLVLDWVFLLLFGWLVDFIFLCLGMFCCWFCLFSCFWLWKFPTSLWFSADRSYMLRNSSTSHKLLKSVSNTVCQFFMVCLGVSGYRL